MDYRTLGRTGLRVSIMGLGCGGPSRVGKTTGKSEAEQVAIIQQALDSGLNFIDTAEAYNTEEVVGQGRHGAYFATYVAKLRTPNPFATRPVEVEGAKLGSDPDFLRRCEIGV